MSSVNFTLINEHTHSSFYYLFIIFPFLRRMSSILSILSLHKSFFILLLYYLNNISHDINLLIFLLFAKLSIIEAVLNQPLNYCNYFFFLSCSTSDNLVAPNLSTEVCLWDIINKYFNPTAIGQELLAENQIFIKEKYVLGTFRNESKK